MKKQQKRPQQVQIAEERIEVKGNVASDLKGIGNKAYEEFWKNLLVGSSKDILKQVAGDTLAGELHEGEEISFKEVKVDKKADRIVAHKEYFREIETAGKTESKKEFYSLERRVEEIVLELKKLTKSSKEMEILFKETTKQEVPAVTGKYHLTFYEWLLSTIKSARIRIEDSKNWMKMFTSKKAQRQYWGMAKKHGTSFTLSNERYTATQTG